jgi:hypothetical protein
LECAAAPGVAEAIADFCQLCPCAGRSAMAKLLLVDRWGSPGRHCLSVARIEADLRIVFDDSSEIGRSIDVLAGERSSPCGAWPTLAAVQCGASDAVRAYLTVKRDWSMARAWLSRELADAGP